MLAAQASRYDSSQTANHHIFSVDQDPFLVNIRWFCRKSFHHVFPIQALGASARFILKTITLSNRFS
jgi:hypothetical protein